MRFENPEIKDGINVSKEHPLKEFFQLLLGVLAVIVVLIAVANLSVSFLAKKIPFSYEEKLVSHIDSLQVETSPEQQQLQVIADKLSVHMDLPEGMKIKVHYNDGATVNAFATIGGNVFFYKGLIEKLPSEEALAMVMAHEIAHIKHRHPIVATGRGLTLMVAGGFISGASGSGAGELLINESMVIGLLKFSRDQESQSDITALKALNAVYDNVQGAKELFDVFSGLTQSVASQPEIFLSHPHSINRWQNLQVIAEQNSWNISQQTQPLSGALLKLKTTKE